MNQQKKFDLKSLTWIHALLGLLAPLLLFLLIGGCKEKNSATPSFGPEVPIDDIEAAIKAPVKNIDPTSIKIGQYVHFSEEQTVNGASMFRTSDTGQTVVSREDQSDRTIYTVVQNKITYSGTESRKASTELQVAVPRQNSGSATPTPTPTPAASMTPTPTPTNIESADEGSVDTEPGDLDASPEGIALTAQAKALMDANTVSALGSVLQQADDGTRVTYHNLTVTVDSVAPPSQVSMAPGCLGIPECKIRVHRIAFDQVTWDASGKGQKASYEFDISEDVPYLAALMNKCITLLVPIASKSFSWSCAMSLT